MQERPDVPLCVDLDGTFILSDMALECLGALLKKNPVKLFSIPFWVLKGRAFTKQKLFENTELSVQDIPLNVELVNWVKDERTRGLEIYLVTASVRGAADKINFHYPYFKEVMATENGVNLRGAAKAQELVKRFGEKGFDYAGNEPLDMAVWRHAHSAIVTSKSAHWIKSIEKQVTVSRSFLKPSGGVKSWLRLLRVHQWVKNILLFFPLLAAHEIHNLTKSSNALVAFFAMSFVASGTYILNDILDLRADRNHPTKKTRPIASGQISISVALRILILCLVGGGLLGTFVSPAFVWMLVGYVICSLWYSLRMKRVLGADVVLLAGFYTFRIFAGSVATETHLTHWFLTFSLFFFLSLALLKRFTEFQRMRVKGIVNPGRGYTAEDVGALSALGCASGLLSILVFVFYISLAETTFLYKEPIRLWLICPLLIYWITRIWILAHRGRVDDDPVVFALKDPASYVVLLGAILVMLWAI